MTYSASLALTGKPLTHDPFTALSQIVEEDESLDLGAAALTIGRAHYPDLDISPYLERLDALALRARKRIGRLSRPERVLSALRDFVWEEEGYRGNADHYYDPANSFLHEVLDRRLGLPITLSVLYLSIGHRLELPLYGVGMPMHFLVKIVGKTGEAFLDPFHGDLLESPEECAELLEQVAGRTVPFSPDYLNATPKRLILYRLLNNLKHLYLQREQPARAGRVIEQMLIVQPNSADDLRDRGILYLQERAYTKGIEWLARYLEIAPQAPDSGRVRHAITTALEHRASQN